MVGLAIGVRLVWVLVHPNAQYSDSVWYDGAAANLVARGQYGLDGPSAWFPPGYPFYLAAIYLFTGHNQLAGKLGNVLLGGAIAGVVYLLTRSRTTRRTALVSGLFVACWPDLIFQSSILSSDLLCAFGFVTVMWLVLRPESNVGQTRPGWPLTIGLGVFIGWMVLVRPVSIILFGSVGLWWWIQSRSFRKAVLYLAPMVAIVVVVIGAWTTRNLLTFHQPILLSTNGGYNFWQSNQRYADGNDTYWWMVPDGRSRVPDDALRRRVHQEPRGLPLRPCLPARAPALAADHGADQDLLALPHRHQRLLRGCAGPADARAEPSARLDRRRTAT